MSEQELKLSFHLVWLARLDALVMQLLAESAEDDDLPTQLVTVLQQRQWIEQGQLTVNELSVNLR